MLVSVCMIARNEAERIANAIQSVQGLADEVVFVDTGSTDNTVEVAREAGALCASVTGDPDNLGESRNLAMKHACGDWHVVLDADERVADPQGLRAFLWQSEAHAVYIKETYMMGDRPGLSFAQMRAWRAGTYQYRYRCHEVPIPTGEWGRIERTGFVFEHRPPARPEKSAHYRRLLEMDKAEYPGDPRPVYYLSRELMYLQEWEPALAEAEQFLVLAQEDHPDLPNCYHNMALCYEQLGLDKLALEFLWKSVSVAPQQRSRWGVLAETYHRKGLHHLAAGMGLCALQIPPVEPYVDPRWYGAYLFDLVARCFWYAGQIEAGRPYAETAVSMDPENQRLRDNLKWFQQEANHASVSSDQ